MPRSSKHTLLVSALALACMAALAVDAVLIVDDAGATRARAGAVVSASPVLAGSWRTLPAAPIAPNEDLTSVWTGSSMLLFGRVEKHNKEGNLTERSNVAAAYDPASRRWRRVLAATPTHSFMAYSSIWTGTEMIVWGGG
ncbi:MAG TPA: hypothetical protein VED41_11920, partial [Solirubrobacteraceae bacterium]|nr:hypothetical protein [Solirubrobacteraceae bacterium]